MPRKKNNALPEKTGCTDIVPVHGIEQYRQIEPIEAEFVEIESEAPFDDEVEYYGSTIPLSGEFVKSIIDNVCQKPVKDNDSSALCSLGIALNSIVATDGKNAIRVGPGAARHYATHRIEAEVEAFRASKTANAFVPLDDIKRRLCPSGTGEVLQMPRVQSIIDEAMRGMQSFVTVDPKILIAIGKVADKAGALSVELFRERKTPGGLAPKICYKFVYSIDQPTLDAEFTEPIEVQGVFIGRVPQVSIPIPEKKADDAYIGFQDLSLELEDGCQIVATLEMLSGNRWRLKVDGIGLHGETHEEVVRNKEIAEDPEGWTLRYCEILRKQFTGSAGSE